MAYTLALKDMGGTDCPYVARGKTMEQLRADVAKHAKKIHGYKEEQLNDTEMKEKIKTEIKQE